MPYKKPKMTPLAAARERSRIDSRKRSKLNADARMRTTFRTPGEVKSGVVMPVGAAISGVYRAAASRRTASGMTPSQRRRANVDPVVVQKRLAALERRTKVSPESQKRARAAADRTERTIGSRLMDKADDAARNAELRGRRQKRIIAKPRFTASNNKRLAERKEALNSPTRGRVKPGPVIRQRMDNPTPNTSPVESMRFFGRATREGYRPAGRVEAKPGVAPVESRRTPKVPRKPKPATALAPRRTSVSQAERTASNRTAQEQAGRYGKGPSDAQKIADRQKWREAQVGKPAKPKAPNPREMEVNKAAIAGERIRPVPARPKTKVSTKIKVEEERVSKQNPRAAEREAKAKADASKPRGTSSPYKPDAKEARNLARRDDVAARRAAAAERLRKDLASRKKGSRKP